jgi:hypothetical protein
MLLLLLSTYVLGAEDFAQRDFAQRDLAQRDRRLWQVSMLSLGTANALDMHSSWGKHELNPALSSRTGTFGAQGALIKLGLQGGLMGVEYLLTRGRPSGKMYRALSIVNFGASAGIGAVAIRNYGVR